MGNETTTPTALEQTGRKARVIGGVCEFCGKKTTEKGTETCAYNHITSDSVLQ